MPLAAWTPGRSYVIIHNLPAALNFYLTTQWGVAEEEAAGATANEFAPDDLARGRVTHQKAVGGAAKNSEEGERR